MKQDNALDLVTDNDAAMNVLDLPQALYSEQKAKVEEMKRLIDKYGAPEDLWKDRTTREMHELHKSRTLKNDNYISALLRSRTSLLSFFMIHNRNEEKNIIIKNLKREISEIKKSLEEKKDQ